MHTRSKKIEIFDSTLREGAQTPYVNFSYKDKVVLLGKMFEIGIDFAEVGYPPASDFEIAEIQKLSKLTKRPILSALGRSLERDIEKCSNSGAEVIDIDLGISEYQLNYLKLSLPEAYKKANQIVEFAVKTKKRVKFAVLDFARTPLKNLVHLYKIVSRVGAEWFTLCDTVGLACPDQVEYCVKYLRSKVKGCKLSVHFHNDFDQATANTIIAALNGVEQLELTINGLGDRAGIAPLAPVVTYLKEVKGFNIEIDLSKLKELSEIVCEMAGIEVSPLEPVVGAYCFTHSPGIHIAGIINNPKTFEPIDPDIVHQKRSFALGRYTGKHAVKSLLAKMGVEIDNGRLNSLVELVKLKSIKEGRKLTKEDLLKLLHKLNI